MLIKFCGGEEECNVPLLKESIEVLSRAAESRELHTSGHGDLVARYTEIIAKALQLPSEEISDLVYAARIHDVGKIFDKYAPILAKEDRLTPEEWNIIKEHPADGANLVATMTTLRQLVPAVRHHHENWDGTGYPDGLRGDAIPLASRIIMFADTFDAMTTKRPYRGPLGEVAVRQELLRCRGKQFDPEIADRLLASDFWRTMFPPTDRVTETPRIVRAISGGRRR